MSRLSSEQAKSIVLYIVFGVATTLINIAVYAICYTGIHLSNVAATVIAWLASVLFAFFTNKKWVFGSDSFEKNLLIRELISFFGCRGLTGLLDLLIMYVAVDVFMQQPIVWKCISNVLVIVLNYIASKLIIFKH